MNAKEQYLRWISRLPGGELLDELRNIQDDEKAIADRFWQDLTFGTGGLRGEIGVGSNRLNIYTIGKVTQGLAQYLLSQNSKPSVCIAYDTRHKSRVFAKTAAGVLCANGIQTYLFDDVRPTPMLSFAVRHLKADAGIVITASHNPKQYNGYKVYGPDGGQITDKAAMAIMREINICDVFDGVSSVVPEQSEDLFRMIAEDIDAAYYEKVRSLVQRRELIVEKASLLSILYTPLYGAGKEPICRVLGELGFSQLALVEEQCHPNGDFPTTPFPNPEEKDVYKLAIEQAERIHPDLVFATDPDCDRIGVLVRDRNGAYSVLTGNQVGALLCDYILNTHREMGTMPANPAIVSTIVTSDMGKKIALSQGVAVEETLTGFKYIGEKIGEWEADGSHSFLFGYEESYGYLAGNFVRDKDAVIAAVLIAEMTLYHREQGCSLFDAMETLFDRYGRYADKLILETLPGQDGQLKIHSILSSLRKEYAHAFPGEELVAMEDYQTSTQTLLPSGEETKIGLPRSNVLKFIFADGSWLVLRPSGTEPKIKLYLSTPHGEERIAQLERLGRALLQ